MFSQHRLHQACLHQERQARGAQISRASKDADYLPSPGLHDGSNHQILPRYSMQHFWDKKKAFETSHSTKS